MLNQTIKSLLLSVHLLLLVFREESYCIEVLQCICSIRLYCISYSFILYIHLT